MTEPNLWDRLRGARIVQVLLVYLGASWVVLQIADVLASALALPEWVLPVAVLLLMIGLVIILATAWVQSLPSTTALEEAGEVPTDWEVAPGDVLESLRSGRLPHLTWGRAILGGVVALSLLFGGTGLYVGFAGSRVGLGPAEAGADLVADGIAVVPFDVRGEGLEIWREGMVDLLSNSLDGVGGYRTIDPRTVLARWKEGVGSGESADLDAALRAAAATGARYALIGSVVGLGDNVRMVSNVYDLDTRKEVAQGQSEGASADVLRLVDDLAVGTIRSLLGSTGRGAGSDLAAETLTTESLPALREFLEGERHYRSGDFAEAVQSFERAVAADTSFAIALVRLSEAYGWLEDTGSDKMREYGERAVAHTDRLPPRYQFIMTAWDALNRGSAEGVPVLQQAVQKYPDDPEAWFLLAETYIHVRGPSMASMEDMERAMERSLALDPSFAPYWVHEADLAIFQGDRARAERAVERYVELAGSDRGMAQAKLAIPLLLGDSTEADAVLDTLARVPERTLDIFLGTYRGWVDQFERMEGVQRAFAAAQGRNADEWVAYLRISRGALASASELFASGNLSAGVAGIAEGHQYGLWEVPVSGPLADRSSASACDEPFNGTCHVLLADALAGTGRWDALAANVRKVRRAADAADAEGNVAAAAGRRRLADVMDAIGAAKRGDAAAARRLLEPALGVGGNVGSQARLTMAELEFSLGRHAEAVRFATGELAGFPRARALYVIAKAEEARGNRERALDAWRHLETITRNADPLPKVLEAREAVARLGG